MWASLGGLPPALWGATLCRRALGLLLVGVLAARSTTAAASDPRTWFHEVRAGEVAGQIAERHQLRLADLERANGGQDLSKIRVGQRLSVPRVHQVKAGEVLDRIARRYGLTLTALRRLNDLSRQHTLRPGQQLLIVRQADAPRDAAVRASGQQPGVSAPTPSKPQENLTAKTDEKETFAHRVVAGEVLGSIARRYAVSLQQLLTHNDLGSAHRIKVGERLRIPVTSKNARFVRLANSGHARSDGPKSYVRLKGHGKSFEGPVLGPDGKILPAAERGISEVLAAWRTGNKTLLDPRLVRLIVRVSNAFGGRPIRVVSGYRQQSYALHSKHKTGQALDFSVPGVPNSVVRDYLLELPDVGVGYYPNSTHVHVDVRGRRSYWVDYSGPGAPPRYRPGTARAQVKAALPAARESKNQS